MKATLQFFLIVFGFIVCKAVDIEWILQNPQSIGHIIKHNRTTLAQIPLWFEETTYDNAVYMYGLPPQVKHLINRDVGDEITYSDLLCYLSTLLKKRISYLELGVSFGKNFLQVTNYLKDSALTGFDFEYISPILKNYLDNCRILDEWPTIPNSMKKTNSSLSQYLYKQNNNIVFYLNGDVFDENTWQRLGGKKFNLIFSDAFHSPDALLHEYLMFDKYNLLDDEFIFVWDDLGGTMSEAFNKIFELMKQKYNLPNYAKKLVQVRGWLGIHEHLHNVGIIIKINR